jgi:hypothetical protein
MQITKNRMMTYVTALFLVLTITATSVFVFLPLTSAHDPPWIVPTNAYVSCSPSTVGVNQYTVIVCWLDRYSPTSGGETGQCWEGFQLDITKPDGSKQTIGPWKCRSAVASDYQTFTPDQVGTYTIVFSWPGGIVTDNLAAGTGTYQVADIGDKFLGATSQPAKLVVIEQQTAIYPETPVPTDYWTLPINAQNRAWSTLPSNWLKGTWLTYGFQNEGTAPSSSHVLWTAPVTASSPTSVGYPGGLADAQWPTLQNNINDYQNTWSTPIIMNGVIYYNSPQTQQSVKYGYYAVDLYDGQQLWFNNGSNNGVGNPYTISLPGANSYSYGQNYATLTLGQMYHYYSDNGDGVASYLWIQFGTTWYMLDPSTGNRILTLVNVPSGTAATDQDGNLLIYSYTANTGNFRCWNSSQAIFRAAPTSTGEQVWRPPNGIVIDAVNDSLWVNASSTWGTGLPSIVKEALKVPHSGYSMNVTDNSLKNLPGTITILQDSNRVPKQIFGKSITTTYNIGGGSSATADTIAIWLANINEHATSYSPFPTLPGSINTNLGFTVTLAYSKTLTVPLPNNNYTWSIPVVNYDNGIFILECQQTRQKWCYNLATGDLKWGPTIQTPQMGFYTTGGGGGLQGGVYYGVYLAMDPNNYYGQIYAYNVTTGDSMWIYNATAAPYNRESAYGDNMPLMLGAVADGKIYVYSTEHSPTNPIWRQSYIRCINMFDGTLVWKLQHFAWGGPAISNGYLVSCSQYDNLIYCIGKGPSSTTVQGSFTSITAGSTAIIQGTVTDQSPGALAHETIYGSTSGVAAVSEESQEAWMEYIYEQQPKPTDATGVPVSIDAIDPNGNLIHIGDATSDTSGTFGYSWTTPNIPGQYTIMASFKGSNSYGSSSAQTYMNIEETAPTPSPIAETIQPQTEMYIIGVGVAIIIAVAIGFAVTILTLRKRP